MPIAGARAQYKGSGTINGEGHYGFMITLVGAPARTSVCKVEETDDRQDAGIYCNVLLLGFNPLTTPPTQPAAVAVSPTDQFFPSGTLFRPGTDAVTLLFLALSVIT